MSDANQLHWMKNDITFLKIDVSAIKKSYRKKIRLLKELVTSKNALHQRVAELEIEQSYLKARIDDIDRRMETFGKELIAGLVRPTVRISHTVNLSTE